MARRNGVQGGTIPARKAAPEPESTATPELSAKDREAAQGWVAYILAAETQETWDAACELCRTKNATRPDFFAHVVKLVNAAAAAPPPVAAPTPPPAKAPPKPPKAPAQHVTRMVPKAKVA
jgi:hypothetical protein